MKLRNDKEINALFASATQGVQLSQLHQQSKRAPTLQSSHRTHRSFWRKVFSHRLHRLTQIRRVWHPCHTHAATKLSSPQNSRNTETTGGEYPPTDCEKLLTQDILPQIAQIFTD